MIDPKTLTKEQVQHTRDHLEAAKKLLEVEGGWIKGAYARNSEGVRVLVDDASACSFCSLGALYRICVERNLEMEYEHVGLASGVLEFILHRKGHRGWDFGLAGDEPSLSGFNDYHNTTHAMVLKLFQDGIDELNLILTQPPPAGGTESSEHHHTDKVTHVGTRARVHGQREVGSGAQEGTSAYLILDD